VIYVTPVLLLILIVCLFWALKIVSIFKIKISKLTLIAENLKDDVLFYREYLDYVESGELDRQRFIIMPLVRNDAIVRFRLEPGLDADGKPGILPEDAVLTWSVSSTNGGIHPPALTVDEDGMGAEVDFEVSATGEQWKVQVDGKSEQFPDFQPFGETEPYEVLPGIVQSFAIREVASE
jgi:hypothetical protein